MGYMSNYRTCTLLGVQVRERTNWLPSAKLSLFALLQRRLQRPHKPQPLTELVESDLAQN